MEQVTTKPAHMWSTVQIILASYLGGPFIASYLLSKNFETFKQKSFAKRTLWSGIVFTLLITVIYVFLPFALIKRMPKMLVPLVYTSVIMSIANVYQKPKIKEALANGMKRASYLKCLLFSLLGIVIQLSLATLISFLLASLGLIKLD